MKNPTQKQISYADALARRAGYRFLSEAEKACFGKRKIGGLDRGLMSDLISWLQGRIEEAEEAGA